MKAFINPFAVSTGGQTDSLSEDGHGRLTYSSVAHGSTSAEITIALLAHSHFRHETPSNLPGHEEEEGAEGGLARPRQLSGQTVTLGGNRNFLTPSKLHPKL